MLPSDRNRPRWYAVAMVALALLTSAAGGAAAPPTGVQGRAAFLQEQTRLRADRVQELHAVMQIRPDQAALWKGFEQRMTGPDARMADLQVESETHRHGRLLDDLALLSRWQSAQATEQRVMVDALRWLYPQLDAAQRKALGEFEANDMPLPPPGADADKQLDAERDRWLKRRAELKQSLQLRPEQAAAWKAFEAETADPMARSRAVLTGPRTAKPPFDLMDFMTRMQEALPTDTADWLAALRRLDRSLDAAQRKRLDAFVEQHPSLME
ncbi:hypothetical protein [Stenotrophomonas sp. PS02289]|uniref:Spy/CpxP family protein refolding chaperone n=1 Tax=Stenotrophomonas sp. PS02289 TaxID=2991422 RepID=UPI00249AC423|nr:hypothetical protein [Stenotrophomonas sp. PS02289]